MLLNYESTWTAGMSGNSLSLVLPELVGVPNHGNHTTDKRHSILRTTNRFVACPMPVDIEKLLSTMLGNQQHAIIAKHI